MYRHLVLSAICASLLTGTLPLGGSQKSTKCSCFHGEEPIHCQVIYTGAVYSMALTLPSNRSQRTRTGAQSPGPTTIKLLQELRQTWLNSNFLFLHYSSGHPSIKIILPRIIHRQKRGVAKLRGANTCLYKGWATSTVTTTLCLSDNIKRNRNHLNPL